MINKGLKGWLLRIAWIFGLIIILTVHLNLWIQGSEFEAHVIVASIINFIVEGGILVVTAKKVFSHDFSDIPGYRDPKGEQNQEVK